MSGDIQTIVGSTVEGLGYELVDIEQTSKGLLRIYIDKESGISVEDCANVSNHLSRVFAVEGVDFERLEISSPGLDRPLKSSDAFRRFIGRGAKVKLNAVVDGRKRFDGVIQSVEGVTVSFQLIEEPASTPAAPGKPAMKAKAIKKAGKKVDSGAAIARVLVVPLENIDRARLIPEI